MEPKGKYISEEKLQEILEKHQKWLEGEEDGEFADLSYANLSGANLKIANLAYSNLSNAILDDANLEGTNFYYINK